MTIQNMKEGNNEKMKNMFNKENHVFENII